MCKLIFENTQLDASPRPLIEIITDISVSIGLLGKQSEAMEKAEIWNEPTLLLIQKELSGLVEMGRPSSLTFNSSSAYMIQGACFIEPTDNEEIREKKTRRLAFRSYHDAFSRITPRQFEFLCGRVIELIGVKNPKVTRSSADEGIDFYGQLSLESIFFPKDLYPTIQKQLSIWIVGQAKHYPKTQSGTSIIRELVGAITLGRAGAFGSIGSPFDDFRVRVGDPIFALLITTGSISSNAWRLLKASGIIGIDGEMLAAFLADREAGLKDGNFDSLQFLIWIEE